jgi:hypothetical protein
MLRFVDRLAVDKSSESPSAGGRISLGVLDHDLDRGGRSGNGGGFEFGRLAALPGELDEHGPVGERQSARAEGFDCRAVADDGAKLVERLGLERRRDQLPLPVSLGDRDPVGRRAAMMLAVRAPQS